MKVKRLVFCLMLSVMLVVTFIPVSGFAVEAETDNDVIAEGLTDGTDEEGSLEEITFEGADEDDCLWSDGTVTYNVVLPDNVEGDFNLIVGVNDPTLTEWEPRFTEGVEYSFDDGTLTLYGDKIFEALGEEGDIAAYATITDADEGVLLAEGFASIFVQKASVDYSLPEDITEVMGMNRYLDEYIEADVYGAEHPFGEVVNCPITDMKVIEQNPSGVVSLEKEDESWVCSMNKLGTAVIEVTYEDVYQEEQTCTFNVNVVKINYEAALYAEKDLYEGLPGDSLHLYTNAYVVSADEEVDEDPEFEYEWAIIEGAEFAEIEQDAKDPSKAVVTFSKDMDADENGYLYEEVKVRVGVKVDGEEKASAEALLSIRDEYNVVELDDPDSFNPDLGVDESMTITPVVHHFKLGQDSYDVVEDVEFSADFFENEFSISQQDGTFTIERLEPWATDFYITATLGSGEEVGRTFKLNRLDDDPSYDDDNEFVDPVDADAEAIEPGQEKHVNTEVKDGLFKFTAKTAGKYVFYSKSAQYYGDPKARIVEKDGDVVAEESYALENYLGLINFSEDDFQIYFNAKAGQTYYLQAIGCYDTAEFDVGLVKSDIASISYKQIRDPYPIRADIDVFSEEDEDGNEVLYWDAVGLEEGDELTLTKTNGTKATYKLQSYIGLDDEDDWGFVNVADKNDILPAFPRIDSYWAPVKESDEIGDILTTDLNYAGCSAEVRFEIVENPIQKVEASTDVITAELDDEDDYLCDWEKIPFTVTTKDGKTAEYIFTVERFDEGAFIGWLYNEDLFDYIPCTCEPWGYDDEGAAWEVGNTYNTTVKTAGFAIDLDVVVKNHEHQWGPYFEPATLSENGVRVTMCELCGATQDDDVTIYRPDTESIQFAAATYNGRAQMPQVTIKDINGDPIAPENYDVTYSNNVYAGAAAKAVITFKGDYRGTIDKNFKINKANQRMVVRAATKTLKAKKLKKKAQIVSAITVVRQGAVPTYRKLSGAAKLTVNAKTGKITVKKKTKKGTYRIKVRVTSGATTNYNAAYRDVLVTVKVK